MRMITLRLLYADDDAEVRKNLAELLQDEIIDDKFQVEIACCDLDKEHLFEEISKETHHIVILDIYKGKPSASDSKSLGLDALERIKNNFFAPIIFYSGNTTRVKDMKSMVVGVATKGDGGIDELKSEIRRLAQSNIPFLKEKIRLCLKDEFRKYFWDIIHEQKDIFRFNMEDLSLSYLMLRNFASSLSKKKIYEIVQEDRLTKDKIHPMEFYLYPTDISSEYQSGELLSIGNNLYVVLTPSCDFVKRSNGLRKVELVLLAKTILLTSTREYSAYKQNQQHRGKLINLMGPNCGDRYFFLPGTPFIEDRIVDFQQKISIPFEKLEKFKRVARLDSPFAEACLAKFSRYSGRIGTPDLDTDLIMSNLDSNV